MSDKPPPAPTHRLRSALDRVLVHDIKNMGFRLQMLLSNIDEHYDDPEFKRSVQELLQSTVERLDGMVERFSAHEDALLIKVALDLNGVIPFTCFNRHSPSASLRSTNADEMRFVPSPSANRQRPR